MRSEVNGYVGRAEDLPARERHMKRLGMMDVTWRSASPWRPHVDHIELRLETSCGAALRFRMAKTEARRFHEALGEALYGEPGFQPEMSGGSPSREGSPHDGQSSSPAASDSAAACAEGR